MRSTHSIEHQKCKYCLRRDRRCLLLTYLFFTFAADIKRNEWEIWKSLKIHHRQEKLEESARFLPKSLAVNRIFPTFVVAMRQSRWKSSLEVAVKAEARYSCGHGQANSSVSWNLVNWNVERTQFVWASPHQYMVWIPLSYFLFYGFYRLTR